MLVRPLALILFAFALAGCRLSHLELGPTQNYAFASGSSAVDCAEVEVHLGVGTLVIEPGTEEVIEADCRTNVVDFRPRLHERRRDGTLYASLTSGQEGLRFNLWDYEDLEHNWQVRLGDALPMDLDIDFGAGEANLELGGLPLRSLELDAGMASFKVNFTEPNPEVMERLVVDAGAAELKIRGLGNANAQRMVIDCGVGEYLLDFRGDWRQSATVQVEGGMGSLRIIVPEDIGVRVTTDDTFLASVKHHGLHESGRSHVNDLYGESEIQLDIHVEFSFGDVSIRERRNEEEEDDDDWSDQYDPD